MMESVWISAGIIVASLATAFVLLTPRVSRSDLWRATATPLASIIGSGFLILGPLLVREYGRAAPLVMIGLCIAAYSFGAAVRYNIRYFEPLKGRFPWHIHIFETTSSWTLAIAFVISVTYYLNLMGAFAVSLTSVDDQIVGRIVTTAVLVFIGLYGALHGLRKLEDLEETAVTIKLAIIGGLLFGMVVFSIQLVTRDELVANPTPVPTLHSLFIAFGLVICVQGFETSRYLGEEYDADTRILTMKYAQWASSIIYTIYTALMAFTFDSSQMGTSETAIIDVTRVIAPVLPVMLVVAALAAQFSAAVADTAGCGGLVGELSKQRLLPRTGYIIVMIGGLLLTWTADIYEIIAWASRAFAVYYALQSAVAASLAFKQGSRWTIPFVALAAIGAGIAIFGIPAE